MIYSVFPNDHIIVVIVTIMFHWLLNTSDYLRTTGKDINFVTQQGRQRYVYCCDNLYTNRILLYTNRILLYTCTIISNCLG